MTSLVELELADDGVAVVTLADPDRRNALSKQLSDDLAAAVDDAVAQDAGAIVLAAKPPVFCSGGSLDALLAREHPLNTLYEGFLRLASAPIPTIAAVNGGVIGAGVNLPLGCDVVIAGESARFDPRFLDVGIHPGGGHLWRLVQRVGTQGAAALVLCGDSLTGPEAVTAGLAWRCVADADVLSTARKLAKRAAGRSRPLVRRTKESLVASIPLTNADEAVALELAAQQWSVEQPEFPEAVRRVQAAIAARPKNQPDRVRKTSL